MTPEEIAKIRRDAKLEAVAEFERRIKNYYTYLRGNTYAGIVAHHVGVKADEYKEEIFDEYEREAHGLARDLVACDSEIN